MGVFFVYLYVVVFFSINLSYVQHCVTVAQHNPRPSPLNKTSCHNAEGQVKRCPEWKDSSPRAAATCHSLCVVCLCVSVCVGTTTLQALLLFSFFFPPIAPPHGLKHEGLCLTPRAEFDSDRQRLSLTLIETQFSAAAIAAVFSTDHRSVMQIYQLSKKM